MTKNRSSVLFIWFICTNAWFLYINRQFEGTCSSFLYLLEHHKDHMPIVCRARFCILIAIATFHYNNQWIMYLTKVVLLQCLYCISRINWMFVQQILFISNCHMQFLLHPVLHPAQQDGSISIIGVVMNCGFFQKISLRIGQICFCVQQKE